MAEPGNILVIRLSSLGDVLMTVPAVKALRRRYPGSRISWLVEGPVGELLARQDFIDHVIQFPRGRLQKALSRGNVPALCREAISFVRTLRDRRYDLITDFHGIFKSVVLGGLAQGTRKIGFGRTVAKEQSHIFYDERIENPNRAMHKVDRNLLLARALGVNGFTPSLCLAGADDADRYVGNFLADKRLSSPFFAMNPFSSPGTAFKRWFPDRYSLLAKRLHETYGAKSLILWGPGEEEEAREIALAAGEAALPACPTTVVQLFSLLQRSRMYIGGDTGVMHLAVAAGIPVLALFGPTDCSVNAPFGDLSVVVKKDMPCSPCKEKACASRRCMEAISVDDVYRQALVMCTKGWSE